MIQLRRNGRRYALVDIQLFLSLPMDPLDPLLNVDTPIDHVRESVHLHGDRSVTATEPLFAEALLVREPVAPFSVHAVGPRVLEIGGAWRELDPDPTWNDGQSIRFGLGVLLLPGEPLRFRFVNQVDRPRRVLAVVLASAVSETHPIN